MSKKGRVVLLLLPHTLNTPTPRKGLTCHTLKVFLMRDWMWVEWTPYILYLQEWQINHKLLGWWIYKSTVVAYMYQVWLNITQPPPSTPPPNSSLSLTVENNTAKCIFNHRLYFHCYFCQVYCLFYNFFPIVFYGLLRAGRVEGGLNLMIYVTEKCSFTVSFYK